MLDLAKLARPYAQAAFEHAEQTQQLSQWSQSLQLLAAIVVVPAMAQCLKNPNYSNAQHYQLCKELLPADNQATVDNLLKLLAEKRKLGLLPEINTLFTAYLAEQEKTLAADVISATALTGEQKRQLSLQLGKQAGRKIALQETVDASLLGGIIIKIGDKVIDHSVRGQLSRLEEALSD